MVRIIRMAKHSYPNATEGLDQNNTYVTYN